MEEHLRQQLKGALLKCANENEDRFIYTGEVVISRVCRTAAEYIKELENNLQDCQERTNQLTDLIRLLIKNRPDTYSGSDIEGNQRKMFAFNSAVQSALKFLETN